MNDLIRLRDEFAMVALQSIGTWMPTTDQYSPEADLKTRQAMKARAEWAYRQADAMMEARQLDIADSSPMQCVGIETAAKTAYQRITDNDPVVHSNRFPSWSELTEEQRNEWRRKVPE
jgi:hypothetical protein